METRFVVMCARDGGPSGFAQAPLKSNGAVVYFETPEAAQAKATELDRRMNNPYAIAFYRYWIEEEL